MGQYDTQRVEVIRLYEPKREILVRLHRQGYGIFEERYTWEQAKEATESAARQFLALSM